MGYDHHPQGSFPERPLDPPEYDMPICPICGSECEKIYILGSAVIGCDECIEVKSAFDWQEEQDELAKARWSHD